MRQLVQPKSIGKKIWNADQAIRNIYKSHGRYKPHYTNHMWWVRFEKILVRKFSDKLKTYYDLIWPIN